MVSPQRKRRQNEAGPRNEAWAQLDPETQLKRLDERTGACAKQRAKIARKLGEANE